MNLPQADKVKAMENEMSEIKRKCNEDVKLSNQRINQVESKVANMSQEMKEFASRVEKRLKCPQVKRIENGVLEKKDDECQLECNPGAYAVPQKKFKCSESDFCTYSKIKCLAAKSCLEILQNLPASQNGVYTIFSQDASFKYEVFCDMVADGGGWALAAVIANGDANNWVFGDADKDYGDSNALWENSLTLGKVDSMTSKTAKDFKSQAFIELPAKELLITFKGKRISISSNMK